MAIAYDARRVTKDVDAAFAPVEEVRQAAATVASRRGLIPGWLDDAAKVFVPVAGDPDPSPIIERGSVEVAVASARCVLAMKVRASRGRQDRADLELLIRVCGVSSREALLAIYESFFPEDPLPARAYLMLDELLP